MLLKLLHGDRLLSGSLIQLRVLFGGNSSCFYSYPANPCAQSSTIIICASYMAGHQHLDHGADGQQSLHCLPRLCANQDKLFAEIIQLLFP